MKKVSVIILNWNRKNDVSKTLDRLGRQTVKPFEIIVVDNASTDGSIEFLNKKYPKVKLVSLKKNIALAGFNEGMKAAKGDFYLHLASDAIPDKYLIKRHLQKFTKNPRLGVSCPITFIYGTKTPLGPNYEIAGDNITGHRVTYFDGNGICLKEEVFKITGGYSKEYFICLEELEWAVRILSKGFEIRCFTDLIVFNSRSPKGNQRKRYGYYYARNWIWFYAKYLPVKNIFSFALLHLKSFFVKTNKSGGTMNKLDIIKGVIAGLIGMPKYLIRRKVLRKEIVDRLKLDLFPNDKHLYV